MTPERGTLGSDSRGEPHPIHEEADMTAETTTGDGVVLTDTAASKVKALLDAEGREDLTLRIAV